MDHRQLYPSNLTAPDGSKFPVCVISGWPVIDIKKSSSITFESGNVAIADDWTKVVSVSKTIQSSSIKQVIEFVIKWCGPPMKQYSFQ